MILWPVILWLVFALVVGGVAGARGCSNVGWSLLAILLSPLIAGLILAILPDLRTRALLEDIRDVGGVNDRELERNVRRGKRGR
jgi:hypothetical protein